MVVETRDIEAPVPALRAVHVPPDRFAVVNDDVSGSMRDKDSLELIPRITVACPVPDPYDHAPYIANPLARLLLIVPADGTPLKYV